MGSTIADNIAVVIPRTHNIFLNFLSSKRYFSVRCKPIIKKIADNIRIPIIDNLAGDHKTGIDPKATKNAKTIQKVDMNLFRVVPI